MNYKKCILTHEDIDYLQKSSFITFYSDVIDEEKIWTIIGVSFLEDTIFDGESFSFQHVLTPPAGTHHRDFTADYKFSGRFFLVSLLKLESFEGIKDFLKPEDELYVNWKFDFDTETHTTYTDFIVPVLFLHVFKDNVGYQLPITSDILITNNIETRNEYILSTINALKNNQKNKETLIDKNLN